MAPEVRDGRHIDNNRNPSLKPSDVWCVGLILFELVTLIPVWDLKFDITMKLLTDPGEVYTLVNDISIYDQQITSLIKKCLHPDPEKRPTIDQILKKKFVKKHLKLLERHKQKYKQSAVMPSFDDSESYYSRQLSSDDSFGGSEEFSEYSHAVEDQGEVDSGLLGGKKKRRKRAKRRHKVSKRN